MEILLILVWLACGLGGAAIASAKNRSGCGYGCLSFFFGPIGLLIAIGMPAAPEEEVKQPVIAETAETKPQQEIPDAEKEIAKLSKLFKSNLVSQADYKDNLDNFIEELKTKNAHFPNKSDFLMAFLPAKEDGILTEDEIKSLADYFQHSPWDCVCDKTLRGPQRCKDCGEWHCHCDKSWDPTVEECPECNMKRDEAETSNTPLE